MSNTSVKNIADALRAADAGLEGALGAAERAAHQAHRVASHAGDSGFRKIAAIIGEVAQGIQRIQVELSAHRKTMAEAAESAEKVPDDANPEQIEASLGPVAGGVDQIPQRLHAVHQQVSRLQNIAGQALRGGKPAPLLGMLDDVKKPLPDVHGLVAAARKDIDEAVNRARDTGQS